MAPIGGALPARPHVWLQGGADSGKSWLLSQVLGTIMREWCTHILKGTSVAGVRRAIMSRSVPVLYDEVEPGSRASAELMGEVAALMRVAYSGEGSIIKADMSPHGGDTIEYCPRSAFLLASVHVPQLDAPTLSRLALVRLGDQIDDWPGVSAEILGCCHHAADVLAAILENAAIMRESAAAIMRQLVADGLSQRVAEVCGTLAGCAAWAADEPRTRGVALARRLARSPNVNLGHVRAGAGRPDVLSYLLAAPIECGRPPRRAVSQVLDFILAQPTDAAAAGMSPAAFGVADDRSAIAAARSALSAVGLALTDDGRLAVAAGMPAAMRLLRDSRLESVDLRRALLDVPGARPARMRIAAAVQSVVVVPWRDADDGGAT